MRATGISVARDRKEKKRSVVFASCFLDYPLLLVKVLLERAKDEFSIKRLSLKKDIEAFSVLVRKGDSDIQPKILFLISALDNRVRAVRWFRHRGYSSSAEC